MNGLKFGVLACGLIGLVFCFIPNHGVSYWDMHNFSMENGGGGHVFMVLGGFALGLAAGAVPAIRPPMERWQALLGVVGFGFVLWKLAKLVVAMIEHGNLEDRGMSLSAIVGLLLSLLALAKPESAR